MKIIKRWTAGLTSRVDWMVSQVENQEALVNSALRESRQSAARAKVQLGRVKQDGQRLRQKLGEAELATVNWRDRAIQTGETNEEKAVECLRRSKRAEQLVGQLRQRLAEHEQVEHQLGKDVRAMEEQLQALVEKRNMMRTRQSRAEAVKNIHGSSEALATGLDDIFERWETRVTENELAGACCVETDPFEDAFVSEEEEADLRSELNDLIKKQ